MRTIPGFPGVLWLLAAVRSPGAAAVRVDATIPGGNIPTFIRVTNGKVHDVNILDEIVAEAGAFYVLDRGYLDFERLYQLAVSAAFFVVRTKENILIERRYSHPVDPSTGVRSDQTVILTSAQSAKAYPAALRRVHYRDPVTEKRLKFLTNNFVLPALTIAQIHRCRRQAVHNLLPALDKPGLLELRELHGEVTFAQARSALQKEEISVATRRQYR